MLRISVIIYLVLFASDSICQSKTTKSYFIPPISLKFDSTSIENLSQSEDVKKLSNSPIPIFLETFGYDYGVELYYKKDSAVWYGIYIEYSHVEVDTVNLDNSGKPELILKCSNSFYGAGGGSTTGAFMVINIDNFPIELMNLINSCSEEVFTRVFGDDRDTSAYLDEYERDIICENRSIIVKDYIETTEQNCDLTRIPTGIYKMIEGRLTLVTK
jgi:hypothetical protein